MGREIRSCLTTASRGRGQASPLTQDVEHEKPLMSRVRDIWEQGAEIYDEIYANNLPYHRSHAVVVDLLPKTKAITVIDLGAGTGLLASRILDSIPSSSVTCLDFSSRMIRKARERLDRFGDRVHFVCADLAAWPASQPYDAVVACNALVYKGMDLRLSYTRCAGLLRPGGLLINSTVIETGEAQMLSALGANLRTPEHGEPSPQVREFAATAGKQISHFGEGSLAFAIPVEEHVELIAAAGLRASCPWHYMTQAVIVGQSSGEERNKTIEGLGDYVGGASKRS